MMARELETNEKTPTPVIARSELSERRSNLTVGLLRSFRSLATTKRIIWLVLGITFFSISIPAFAACSPKPPTCKTTCCGTVCNTCEIGDFMQGISAACGNTGDCTLTDIMSVVANIGNWILGIIALIVFVIYIYGGIKILMGGAHPDFEKQEKTAIKTATIGLIIVFVANLGLKSIEGLLKTGSLGGGKGVVRECTANTINTPCGDHRVCTERGCEILCDILYAVEGFQCMETNNYNDGPIAKWCQTDQCPGGDTQLCCNPTKLSAEQTIEDIETLNKIERIRTGQTPSRPEEP